MEVESVKWVPEFLLLAIGSGYIDHLCGEEVRNGAVTLSQGPVPVRQTERVCGGLELLFHIFGCLFSIVLYALVDLFLTRDQKIELLAWRL